MANNNVNLNSIRPAERFRGKFLFQATDCDFEDRREILHNPRVDVVAGGGGNSELTPTIFIYNSGLSVVVLGVEVETRKITALI